MSTKPTSTYVVTRWLFFRGLGVVYLAAFGSYALLILGLNGSSGIAPTHDMLQAAKSQLGSQCFYLIPTVEWLDCSDAALLAIVWGGTILSVLVILGVMTGPALVVLCLLWLSLVSGGGEFTAFQSDGMLVEATVLSLFFVPWQFIEPPWQVPKRFLVQGPPTTASLLLLRFMIFRLMLAAGLVKILSGDESWANLTAMNYHFETQPIPTPLAWYFHWLPEWAHKDSVVGMFFSELLAPFLIFTTRSARIVAAVLMAGLHLMIALTGNYTFLNMLCILLCVSLLDDALVSKVVPRWVTSAIQAAQEAPEGKSRLPQLLVNTAAAVLIGIAACQLVGTVSSDVLPGFLTDVLSDVAPFHLAGRYGLFAVMTKSRPEIVFEGTDDGISWKSYEFKYKPGDDLKRPPPIVEPHMPRLDWRLWFAAMEPVESNEWVLNLVKQLLLGNPAMNQFFVNNPFPLKPPVLIRAFVYDYHFTTPEEKQRDGAWWKRDNQKVYLPPTAVVNGKLVIVR